MELIPYKMLCKWTWLSCRTQFRTPSQRWEHFLLQREIRPLYFLISPFKTLRWQKVLRTLLLKEFKCSKISKTWHNGEKTWNMRRASSILGNWVEVTNLFQREDLSILQYCLPLPLTQKRHKIISHMILLWMGPSCQLSGPISKLS